MAGETIKFNQDTGKVVPGQETPQAQPSAAPDAQKGTTPKPTTKTYTEEQLQEEKQRAVHQALTQQGRDIKAEVTKAITKEREANAEAIKDTQGEIEELKSQLEELGRDDPDKAKLVKVLRDRQEEIKNLKNERRTLADEHTAYDGEIAQARETNFEIALWELASEYEGSDPVRLKTACERAKITDLEGAQGIADSFWVKTSEKSAQPLVSGKPDSGVTSGGIGDDAIRENYRKNPNDPKAYRDYMDYLGRIGKR